MKKCPACGMKFSDDRNVCPNCLSTLVEDKPSEYSYGTPPKEETSSAHTFGGFAKESANADWNPKASANKNTNKSTNTNTNKNTYSNGQNTGGGRILEFYEKAWVIILCTIMFWPLGLALLVIRLIKNSQYGAPIKSSAPSGNSKPTGKRHIGGIILVVIGGILVWDSIYDVYTMDYKTIAGGAVCIIVGAILIFKKKSENSRITLYESAIDNRGNTFIFDIAAKANLDASKVRTELQELISKGFLAEPKNGISAYIDGENDLVVMTKDGTPIVPVEKTVKENLERKQKAEKEAAKAARKKAGITAEEDAIDAIDEAMKSIESAEVNSYLRSMRASLVSIKRLLKEDPTGNEKQSIKKMRSNYIPKTVELIEKYQAPTTSKNVKAQLAEMFKTIATAFENVEKQLRSKRDTETEVDIEVLRKTLERDGLLNSDFEIKL